ncbi:CD99 antigen-like protein 2 isoform X5 [Coregonus clupeaformis]|uniref:CD99 antigen-like protein 2 isoform X5 n=1 Tax=Coregonus clupeaformis TaxID=59861 RepID=UPI001BE05F63|nr:CD99 antigen-like protein 2 isoform X5 [Coregonus clupeaformis]
MGKCSAWSLFLVVSLLAMKALSQNEGGFDLSDALDGDVSKTPAATPKPKPVEGAGEEFFGEDEKITTTNVPPKAPATKAPPHKPKPDEIQADFDFEPSPRPGLLPRATKGPHTPPKPQPGGSFSDDDLFDVGKDDTYNPDKGKGGRGGSQSAADDNNYDTVAETGTIAGIISAIGVALVGMVTSYVSYQKKKFCFSIQQSLNADLVKTDNPEAVVATEPQVQQTLLEPPNAEPPSEENTV